MLVWVPQPFGSNCSMSGSQSITGDGAFFPLTSPRVQRPCGVNQRVRDAFRGTSIDRFLIHDNDAIFSSATTEVIGRQPRRDLPPRAGRHLAAPIPDPLLRTLRLRAACTRTGRRAAGAVRGGGRDRGWALRAVRRAARRQAGGVKGWLLAAGDDSWRTAPGAAPGLDREASRGSRRRCLRDRACTSGRTSEQASTVKTLGLSFALVESRDIRW
jgi:hypothetical protein